MLRLADNLLHTLNRSADKSELCTAFVGINKYLEFLPKVIVLSEVPLYAFILLHITWTDSTVQYSQ